MSESSQVAGMRAWKGKSYPLGATWDGMGVNFATFSPNASGAELCLSAAPRMPTRLCAFSYGSARTRHGIASYPMSVQASSTAGACRAPTRLTKDTVSIPQSC